MSSLMPIRWQKKTQKETNLYAHGDRSHKHANQYSDTFARCDYWKWVGPYCMNYRDIWTAVLSYSTIT